MLYIWNGGIAIYGGVIGAIIGVAVFCKVKKVNLFAVLDLTLSGFLIGQLVGRWGNFFNREAFGAATDSFFRMGLLNTVTGQVEYYHPTFLYESLWNLAGFLLLNAWYPRRRYNGQIAWVGPGLRDCGWTACIGAPSGSVRCLPSSPAWPPVPCWCGSISGPTTRQRLSADHGECL